MREPDYDGLLRRISGRQWRTWRRFLTEFHTGPDADDLRAGLVASATMNAAWGRKGKAVMPGDLFPWLKPAKAAPAPSPWDAPDMQLMLARGICLANGGAIVEARK